jgi:hypothetical protein
MARTVVDGIGAGARTTDFASAQHESLRRSDRGRQIEQSVNF